MKICAAQTRPERGDVDSNIAQHRRLIQMAVKQGVEAIIFPELSLTGYEPSMSSNLAISLQDDYHNEFQVLSDQHGLFIAMGAPVLMQDGVGIGMIQFRPCEDRSLYTKQYLHKDEEPFFVAETCDTTVQFNGLKMAVAICYEISVPEHVKRCFEEPVDIYLASVAKTERGSLDAHQKLSGIARRYGVPVLMSNCVGMSEEGRCDGRSAVWNSVGKQVGLLDNEGAGLLIYDMKEQVCTKIYE